MPEGAAVKLNGICGLGTHMWCYGSAVTSELQGGKQGYKDAYTKSLDSGWEGYKDEAAIIIEGFGVDNRGLGHELMKWAYIPMKFIIVMSNVRPENVWEGDQGMINAIRSRFHVVEFMTPEEGEEVKEGNE